MENLKKVSRAEALEIFKNVKGNPFSYFAFLTKPVLVGGKKSYDPFGGIVYKYSRYTFVVNRDYDKNVENTLKNMGIDPLTWKPQPHNYATHLKGNVLIHNLDFHVENPRYYIQFLLHEKCQIEAKYFDVNFNEIPLEKIKPFLKVNISKKQSDMGIEAKDQIKPINPSLESIRQFTLNKIKYEIV